jgi:hypothetical protein
MIQKPHILMKSLQPSYFNLNPNNFPPLFHGNYSMKSELISYVISLHLWWWWSNSRYTINIYTLNSWLKEPVFSLNYSYLAVYHFLFLGEGFSWVFFGGTWVWTQGFSLAKQVLNLLSYTSSSLLLFLLGDRVSQCSQGWPLTQDLPASAWHYRYVPPHRFTTFLFVSHPEWVKGLLLPHLLC